MGVDGQAAIKTNKAIKAVKPYVQLPATQRRDLVPFGALYALAPLLVYRLAGDAAVPLWVYLWSVLAAAALHGLCFLACLWNTDVAAWFRYSPVATALDATFVKVQPHEHRGKPALCQLLRGEPVFDDCGPDSATLAGTGGRGEGTHSLCFKFQHRTYAYDFKLARFEKIRPPLKLPLDAYKNAKGLPKPADAATAAQKYGDNNLSVPRRQYLDLVLEQCTAPFFVFQVFCVALWMLDEYWYYALFTLAMLIFFECTVAVTRQRNAEQMHKMEPTKQPVMIYREGRWTKMNSTDLVAGDLFVLSDAVANEDVVCPCDGLLVAGACVMNEVKLTGESVPQMKEGVDAATDPKKPLEMGKGGDKLHILYGGTKMLMITQHAQSCAVGKPPGSCVVIYALRTGFDTSQGKLMRTILYSTESVSANSAESFVFILILLLFAICASAYVLHEGLKDPKRDRFKLFLSCTIILTSVIPPELPMELSLAVNNSLMALMKCKIYCTEPFRIPAAGKIDVCCFDKTGTLTSDKMIVRGIAGLPSAIEEDDSGDMSDLIDCTEASLPTMTALATAHSLVIMNGEVFGDPLERAALDAVGWELGKRDRVGSKVVGTSASIIARHHFNSSVKRMAVVAMVDAKGTARSGADEFAGPYAFAKGAPEVMHPLFDAASLPADFVSRHRYFALKGDRVLALGYKKLQATASWDELRSMSRTEIESQLIFAGFLVLSCPLKRATKDAIKTLRRSNHGLMMITGDHMLTACFVAKEVNVTEKKKKPLVLQKTTAGAAQLEWRSLDEKTKKSFELDVADLEKLQKDWSLCIGGEALALVADSRVIPAAVQELIARTSVFARTSPVQKEVIITALKDRGLTVMMCGDGTNDVGALKQAHVGVGLLEAQTDKSKKGVLAVSRKREKKEKKAKKSKGLQALIEEAEQSSTVQLGDASIASPFTSRTADISACTHIIRQGRCTLTTTTQMFQIIALNCLVSAYSLSVLYLDGVKYGDSQATTQGLVVAGAFLFVSRAQPLDELSPQRPHSSLFAPGIWVSIVAQFAIHMTSLTTVVAAAKKFERTEEEQDSEADFKINNLNSAVFLVSTSMQLCSFLVNYKGKPFMQGLFENKPLMIMLSVALLANFTAASTALPPLNEELEIVLEWPTEEFATLIMTVLTIDLVAAAAAQCVIGFVFPLPTRPKS